MANKSKITVISGLLSILVSVLALVSLFVDKFEGILAILNPVLDLIRWVWYFFFSNHSFSLDGWLWLIIGALTFVGLFVVLKTVYDKNSRDKYTEKEGVISGLKFRWKESKGSIYNLRCFCPRCDYELTRDRNTYVKTFGSWTLPSCPGCNFRSNALEYDDLRDLVEREIERKKRNLG
ncbi:MAG: hypothetical protein OXH16_03285 [Gemmatimonadetes bacterium]|nr:hypothetical protein [Gemmatimonadota bacterium]